MRLAASILAFSLLIPTTTRGQYLDAVIPVGTRPTKVLWNPTSNKVYVSNTYSNTVTIINGSDNSVITTLQVPTGPLEMVWNSRDNKVYAVCGEGNRVAVICGYGDTLIRRVHVSGWPTRLTYCETLNKLYVCQFDDRALAVLDAGPDTLVATVLLGLSSWPYQVMWHPNANRVFCSVWGLGDSVLVVDCASDEIVERLMVGDNPYAWCWNPATGLAYVTGAYAVYALSANGDSIVASIPVSGYATAYVCIAPDLGKLYVGDFNDGDVTVVDCVTHTVLDTLHQPEGGVDDLLYDGAHHKLYCPGGWYLLIFDAVTDTLVKTIRLGAGMYWMARNAYNSRVYISDEAMEVVYVIRDTTTGVAEVQPDRTFRRRPRVPGVATQADLAAVESGTLLDATGRVVARLSHGRGVEAPLKAGVYFLLCAEERKAVKVVIPR